MTYANAREALADLIRFVPDFPEEGVVFEDLTPALADAEGFRLIIDDLTERCRAMGAEVIAGLDARGFLLGSAVAYKLGVGLLAVRKKGKLPPPVHSEVYELEYGTAALEVPANGIHLEGRRVVLVDDVLATGGTMGAAMKLLEHCGATIGGLCVVLEVEGLGGREALAGTDIYVVDSPEGR
ncbi:adenine phosphoribosyltransferase [Corynebacterium sp.]|uniref:adenine phosphoribosyltransferase n=1 Tax=Corynebacterium sp. TaxID=1720 RepID=UPI0026DCD4A9|nr:adenine phosphoribosyltransferase [Corynebacterium sp.]MDO4609462.1 adenine phosphoribosyltransferase [Corynebacterium sp.]